MDTSPLARSADQPTPPDEDGGRQAPWHNPLLDPRDLRMPRIAGPSSLVIFGVTGDLAKKSSCRPSMTWPTGDCCQPASG